YAGTDRYDTAARLARGVWPKGSDVVFHAPGANFPDALAGTPAARVNNAPILLTRGTCAPAPTAAFAAQFAPALQVALGGPDVTYVGVKTCTGPSQPAPKMSTTTTAWSTVPVTMETGISQPVSVRVKTGDKYIARRVLLQFRSAPGKEGWNVHPGEAWFTLESVLTDSDGWYRGQVGGNSFGSNVYRVVVPETATAAWTATGPLLVTQSGIAWADAKTVRPRQGGLQSISCPTTSFCAAVDERGYAVTFTGTGWTKPVALETGGYLRGVSCASTSFCLAVSYSGRVYRFNGTGWSATTAPGYSGLTAVECPSSTFCAAIGSGFAHVFNGTGWVRSPYFGDVGLVSISCPTMSFCAVLDAHGSVATLDAKAGTWSKLVPTAPERRNAQAISCASAAFCAVTDYAGKVNTFDGATWSTPVVVAGLKTFSSISCPEVGWCVTFTAGNVAVLSDGAWTRSASVFAGNAQVDCVAAGSCVAVDAQKASVLSGGSWSRPVMADPVTGTGQDISCVTSSFCFAVDSQGGLSRWGGSSWSAPQFLAGDGGLRSVSCVTTTFCVAVGPTGSFVFDGATWRAVPTTSPLRAVSCASPTFCAAVHENDYLQTFNGTAWTRLRIVASGTPMVDVDCPSPTFCAVTDGLGRLYTFNGAAVSAPTSFPDEPVWRVSCSSSRMCVAVGMAVARWDGSRWTRIEPSIGPEAVTCQAAGFCLVVDPFGRAAAYDGSRWTMPMKVLEQFGALDAVDCPDRTWCIGLGSRWESIVSVTGKRSSTGWTA
ncbi:MAG: cell wall-binding repeat-containing protein, partial [Intrasporangium sp.]|uniref:cell wall-binding repeat-containing protein n=1 Tax=Intrasporangium sp. TaxID=1925024 RepID=UPI003F7FB047